MRKIQPKPVVGQIWSRGKYELFQKRWTYFYVVLAVRSNGVVIIQRCNRDGFPGGRDDGSELKWKTRSYVYARKPQCFNGRARNYSFVGWGRFAFEGYDGNH